MTGRKANMEKSSVLDDLPADLLPSCRIQCKPGCIKIGQKEFQSASEALDAYLDQFDYQLTSSTNSTHHSSFTKSSSELETTVSRIQRQKIINDEIQKAKQDLKIHLLKKALDKSQKREQSYLQQEVDDALAKSGELLDKLNTSDDSVPQCPSDIGSLTTDVLLSVNPYQALKPSESNHVFSYHRTPRNRSRESNKSNNNSRYQNKDVITDQTSSSFDVEKSFPDPSFSLNKSKVTINPQDPSYKQKLRQMRSRSVSPTSGKTQFKTPSWVQELDTSSKGPPSWIDGLTPSDISDSLWTDKSQTQKSYPRTEDGKLKSLKEESSNFSNSQPPGLNYSDLSSKSISFNPQPYSDLRMYTAKVISDVDKFLEETDLGKGNESDSLIELETDKVNNHQPKVLHTTLDKYIADISSPFSGQKASSSSIENMPRCSSMDMMLGENTLPKSDITGASSIPLLSATATPKKVGRQTVTFSPHIGKGKSPDSSIILDGDRPWEQHCPLKPPVYVGNHTSPSTTSHKSKLSGSPTFSGGQQPGSMEALKKMLFKLQAEDPNGETKSVISEQSDTSHVSLNMPALKGYNFNSEPGGHSLEKALVHLSRLKSLVDKKEQLQEESVLEKSSHSAPSSPRR